MLRLILLGFLCGGASAASHSLRYFYTWTTPLSGIPEFVTVGYVDEKLFDCYDSEIQRDIPRQRWMEENLGADYWERQTQIARGWESVGKTNIKTALERTNKTGGIHTIQLMVGCELRDDGSTGAFYQYGWDNIDFISFDKDRMVWVTSVSWGEITKNKWDQDAAFNQQTKGYLEGICIEWLKKYLQYGERELRPVKPSVMFTSVRDNKQLSCVATGFYPHSIEVNLFRDGAKINEAGSTGVRPNHDGSYQVHRWMEFDPNSQAKYTCVVDHDGLGQSLVVFYEPKTSSMLPVIIGVVVVLLQARRLATIQQKLLMKGTPPQAPLPLLRGVCGSCLK
uniref:Non-classical MHC class I antigen n=1 Tax=Ginglymostoma cirratum TaxID=7801 RepID=Q8WLW4_GINCI|nr:non-classical MHC class I antigen [Ginglymostoma cirratum]